MAQQEWDLVVTEDDINPNFITDVKNPNGFAMKFVVEFLGGSGNPVF